MSFDVANNCTVFPTYAKSPLNKDIYTVKVTGYQQNYFNFILDWATNLRVLKLAF